MQCDYRHAPVVSNTLLQTFKLLSRLESSSLKTNTKLHGNTLKTFTREQNSQT